MSDALTLRRRAEQLSESFPGLLAEAERVAAIVSQGVHGRRRPGQGETFWQFRPYEIGDGTSSIDWRRSARSDRVFVRENEWEAANAVWFWRDGAPGMDWRSDKSRPTKKDRASILLMALAILLMRGGERCAVIGESERLRTGRAGLERVTHTLAGSEGTPDKLEAETPRHARMIIGSDFLEGVDVWRERLARLSARPARGMILHLIDPAEEDFPYRGRVKLEMPGRKGLDLLIGRAERNRDRYRQEFAAHKQAMLDLARHLGWSYVQHRTDHPATMAVSQLYAVMEAGGA